MNTIDAYLDAMFRDVPRTPEAEKARHELRAMMEDSYQSKRDTGVPETQAIGQVVAEFGSIEELAPTLGLDPGMLSPTPQHVDTDSAFPLVNVDEAKQYTALKKKAFHSMSRAIALFIVSPIPLLALLAVLGEESPVATIIGLACTLIAVAIGVIMLIIHNAPLADFAHVEHGECRPSASTLAYAKTLESTERPRRTQALAIAVGLWIIAGIGVISMAILGETLYGADSPAADSYALWGVCITLLFVALGFIIFLPAEAGHSSAQKLSKPHLARQENGTDPSHSPHAGIRIASSIIWPLTVATYLVSGFMFNAWGTMWVVFPLAAIATWLIASIAGAFSSPSSEAAAPRK